MRKCFITIQFPAGAFRAPFPFENEGRPSLEDTATTTTTKTGIMVMMMLRFCGPCCCGVTEMQLEVKGEKKTRSGSLPVLCVMVGKSFCHFRLLFCFSWFSFLLGEGRGFGGRWEFSTCFDEVEKCAISFGLNYWTNLCDF